MTLNQLIKRVRQIAESHEQVNSFVLGETANDLLDREVEYPVCFMLLPTEQVSVNETTFNLSLFLLSRQIQGGSATDSTYNTIETISDMREVALDIYSQFAYQKFEPQWNLVKGATITPVLEDSPDYLAGVKMDIQIKVNYTINRCQIPTTYNYGN
jgi:hypothetical protein